MMEGQVIRPGTHQPEPEKLATPPRRVRLARPGARRRVAVVALAVTLVVAIAAAAVLNSVGYGQRASSTPSAVASSGLSVALPSVDFEVGGWGWRRVGEPAPAMVVRVANGYLGQCVSGGLPKVCTSRDAVTWSLQADPSIFVLDGDAAFGGWSVAHGSSGWVAVGTVDPGVWRSADGVHWTAVELDVPDLLPGRVEAVDGGFALTEETFQSGKSVTRLLTSSDGSAWTVHQLPAQYSNPRPAGAIGLTATDWADAVDNRPVVAFSRDGSSWQKLTMPVGVMSLTSTHRLPDGGYFGLSAVGFIGASTQFLTSTDGVTWQASTALGLEVGSLAAAGGRFLAVSRIPDSDTRAFSESTGGATWRQVAALDGDPLSGTAVGTVGDMAGLFDGSRLLAVGAPIRSGGTGPSATPPAFVSPAPSSMSAVVGGWRWHRLNIKPDGPVVRLPSGYLAHCRDSMCTSPDGWTWQYGADHSIFSLDSNDAFTPEQYVRGSNGRYVVTDGASAWYSTDGVHFKRSGAPPATFGQTGLGSYVGLAAGPEGFTLIGIGYWDATGLRCRLYTSSDGASWQDAGLTYYLGLQWTGSPDTSGGLLASRSSARPGQYLYSADGRHWAPATVPAGAFPWSAPSRLADGTLLVPSDTGLLRSKDGGRVWTKLATGPQGYELAVAGNRIVATATALDGTVSLRESTDGGASFHVLLGGAGEAQQFGDMVMVSAGGPAYWVGAPLTAAELPGTTATATGLPVPPPSPSPTAQPTPAGGISRDLAIQIARDASHPRSGKSTVSATVRFDDRLQRWIWSVNFVFGEASPTGGQGTYVSVDFFSGEVLGSQDWIS